MPAWKRMANVAGTVDLGKLLKFTRSVRSCRKHQSAYCIQQIKRMGNDEAHKDFSKGYINIGYHTC